MAVSVAVVQTGGMGLDGPANRERLLALGEEAAGCDLVLFPEMITGPYFPVAPYDEAYLGLASRVPGPDLEPFSELARRHGTAVALGLFEETPAGQRYNSVVHLDRRGRLVEGHLPTGTTIPAYRKTAVADVDIPGFTMDEQAYCGFGPGPARFDVDGLRVGTLICYDRAFSELWLGLGWLGVDVVCVAVSSFGWREELFVDDLRLRAMELGVFVVAANRSGPEEVGGVETDYFGRSCVIAPTGEVLAEAGAHTRDEILRAELDLDLIEPARKAWVVADRRPELFRFLAEPAPEGP